MLFVFECSTNNILQTEYKGTDGIILADNDDIEGFKFDRYRLNEISIDGDSIEINLSYSGGCRDHVFKLIAKNYFGDSTVPEAELDLSHNSNFDPCEAFPTEMQIFNLLPLKNEFIRIFDKETGSIRLVLEDKEVVYSF